MLEPAWLAAGAACAAAAAAWFAAINGSRTLRQARRDSQARSRPMMAAELRSPPYTRGTQVLVISNHGPSIARNVRVTFEPEIPDPGPEQAATSVTPFLKRRYAKPIPVLTPGIELDNLYFVGRADAGGAFENTEPTPEQVTVRISYEGPDRMRYDDTFNLDVSLLRQRTYVTSSTSPQSQAKEALKLLKAMRHAIDEIARSMSMPSVQVFEGGQDLGADARRPSLDVEHSDSDEDMSR